MSWLKKKVSGKRRRLKTDKYDIDMSYITETVIAMSFPAHEWKEKFYRNDIDDVVGYLNQEHFNGYHIYNMSNRDIDAAKFKGKVIAFPWEDHHSPSIRVLFEAC